MLLLPQPAIIFIASCVSSPVLLNVSEEQGNFPLCCSSGFLRSVPHGLPLQHVIKRSGRSSGPVRKRAFIEHTMEDVMVGVNKVILIGNLGKDPELRYTPSGQPVATFSLATSERWTDRNGQRQDRTEWHTVVAWGKLGELVNQYLSKGRSAYVEGRINTRSWDDKDGNKRYKTEIVALQVQFLGATGPSTGGQGGDMDQSEPNYDMQQGTGGATPVNVPEDDLPF